MTVDGHSSIHAYVGGSPSSASASAVAVTLLQKFLSTCNHYYHDIWQIHGDPRVAGYPFFEGGPWSSLAMVAAYLYFIKVIGPEFMAHRKPFDLKKTIFIYNVSMVIVSGWMFTEGFFLLNFGLDTWGCQLVNQSSTDPGELRKLLLGWLFFMTKFIEFADTIFFILRKKHSQVTALHVIHHSLVPLLVWIGYKFVPGGSNAFFPLINSLVHTIMYTYYALSTLGHRVQPYLWWKKYLTRLQMVQFVLIILNSMRLLFMPHCNFPRAFIYLTIFNGLLFLVLFASFYRQAYRRQAAGLRPTQTNNNTKDQSLPKTTESQQNGVQQQPQLNGVQQQPQLNGVQQKPQLNGVQQQPLQNGVHSKLD